MSATQERDVTTVQVTRSVHRRLHDLKDYGQSFNDLLTEMADNYEQHNER